MGSSPAVQELGTSPIRGGRPRRRRWLPWTLFAATCLTLLLTGGWSWGVDPIERTGWAYLLAVLVEGVPYALSVVAILGAHELGHYYACRLYGVPCTPPFFIPGPPQIIGTFGAVIRIRGLIPHRRALFDIAAAGPIAGFLVLLPILAIGLAQAEPLQLPETDDLVWFFGTPILFRLFMSGSLEANGWIGAAWVGVLVTSLNLFPVGQLDGGHVAYAISRRLHRVLSRTTGVALLALSIFHVVYGQFPIYTIWVLISFWMRDRHPPLVDEGGRLGVVRWLVSSVLVAIFILSFIVVPIRMETGAG